MPQQPLAKVPLDSNWYWQELARCRNVDPLLFFHPQNERGASRSRRDQSAKRVCAPCPVRLECADYAIRAREPFGVWGGLSEDDREAIHREIEQPRGSHLTSVVRTGIAAAKELVNEAISDEALGLYHSSAS